MALLIGQRVLVINVIVGIMSQVKHFGELFALTFAKTGFLGIVKLVGFMQIDFELGVGLSFKILFSLFSKINVFFKLIGLMETNRRLARF